MHARRPALLASVAVALLAHAAIAWVCLRPNPRPATPRDRAISITLWRTPETVSQAPIAGASPTSISTPTPVATTMPEKVPLAQAGAPSLQRVPETHGARRDVEAVVLGGDAYLGPAELDQVALPRSAPDTSLIEGLPWSGVPLRLRLFVDAKGTVVDVRVLRTADVDDVVDHVRRMFLTTGFIPARAHGTDVASYKDVELNVGGPA